MSFGKRLVQTIELQGQQAKQELRGIGEQGQASFAQIEKSGSGVNATLLAVEANAKRAGLSVAALRKVAASGGANIPTPLDDIPEKAANAEAAFGRTTNAATRFGGTLRLLGRASQIHGLGLLGRDVTVLGRAFALALPLLLIAGLGALAKSATGAASKVADLAGENRASVADFNSVVAAEAAVGSGADAAGKSYKGLSDLIKETAGNVGKAAEAVEKYAEAQKSAKHSLDDIRRAEAALDVETRRSLRDIKEEREQAVNGRYNEQAQQLIKLRSLTEQKADAEFKAAEGERKFAEERRKVFDDLKKAKAEQDQALQDIENNKTALDKLGIAATTSAGKLRDVPKVMDDIAGALERLGAGEQRDKIERDLVAAGLDRNLLPALRRGVEGYKALQEAGKNIRPVVAPEQIKDADDFNIALGQTGQAILSYKDAIGNQLGPTSTRVLNAITKFLVENRDHATNTKGAFAELALEIEEIAPKVRRVADVFTFGVSTAVTDVTTKVLEFLRANDTAAEGSKTAWGGLINIFAQIGNAINAAIERVKAFVAASQEATDRANSINDNPENSAVPGYAGGGRIRGRGTPTSDSIPIWASRDEWMIKAKAAKYYGSAFMDAVNNMRFPKNAIRGYAGGGAIQMPRMPTMTIPRMADGGPIPPRMRPLSVTFPGIGTFNMSAPVDEADRLVKAGVKARLTSGGNKPSSYE
jgi:hypothetical protein